MKNLLKRYIYFMIGIMINSFGIAFITKSALGTSQISSVPYVLSLQFYKISFGQWTFVLNMLFIIGQIILLKKQFHPIQFLQIPANIMFSGLIDVSMNLLKMFHPTGIGIRFVSMIFGCMILAFGIVVEVAPNVITVPGEGIVKALSIKTKIKFGTVKVYFDITLIIIAAILSFIFFGKLRGVGIGTICSAICVGRFVNIIRKNCKFIKVYQ